MEIPRRPEFGDAGRLTDSALLSQEAGWLRIMMKHNMHLYDPEVEVELKDVTTKGLQAMLARDGSESIFRYEPLPEGIRNVDSECVYYHIDQLERRSQRIRETVSA